MQLHYCMSQCKKFCLTGNVHVQHVHDGLLNLTWSPTLIASINLPSRDSSTKSAWFGKVMGLTFSSIGGLTISFNFFSLSSSVSNSLCIGVPHLLIRTLCMCLSMNIVRDVRHTLILIFTGSHLEHWYVCIINPWRACTARVAGRVTVVVLSVCLSVCLFVCLSGTILPLHLWFTMLFGSTCSEMTDNLAQPLSCPVQ